MMREGRCARSAQSLEQDNNSPSQVLFVGADNPLYSYRFHQESLVAGLSSPGIGSGLQINDIITKLMQAESAPLADFDKKTADISVKVSAFGNLSGALSSFQGSLSSLSTLSAFQAMDAKSSAESVLTASATAKATPGNYKINVTQVAQSQTLASTVGYKTATTTIGTGDKTKITFQLGTVTGGIFGMSGSTLGAGVLTGGITPGGLTINGTAIATDSSTRSARALADAINAKTSTTGVSAKAAPTKSAATLFGSGGATTFGAIDTSGGGTYSLSIGGVQIASQAAGVAAGAGIDAAALDAALTPGGSVAQSLANANITVTGSAADGTLQFTNADGANIAISETVTGAVSGGLGKNSATANTGYTTTAMSNIILESTNGSQITIAGTNPAAAGLTAGTGGDYSGASFAIDADRTSGSVTIDATNNTLAGIRDAINKGNFGVTASIVSDGSKDTPQHLVLTSTATGASSTMKISLSGVSGSTPDPALGALLGYDPAGTQGMSQKAAAMDTLANVNGINVTSSSTSLSNAVEGMTFDVQTAGTASVNVSRNTSKVTQSVNDFVKAYNELNSQIKSLSGYDADNKTGGPLLGDSTVQGLQADLRRQMSQQLTGLKGSLTSLGQIGIAFQKDGTLSVDSSKLNKAMSSNFNDVAGLFAAIGKTSDPDISFVSSTTNTKAGDYAINITQAATQATMTSAAPLAADTVIDTDTQWTVTLNDTTPSNASNTATISLAAGTYSPTELAKLMQSAINGASAFSTASSTVTVSVNDDGTLKLLSNKYGSKSNITLSDSNGTSVSSIFGGAAATTGMDVAGTIGGFAASGDGQILTGSAGAPTEGLKLEVKGTTTGIRGDIGFSQGYAYQLNTLASGYLGNKGILTSRTSGLNQSLKDIQKDKDAFNLKLVDIEARYRKQYTALDTAVASMNATMSYLTQQLAQISANG
jgi:flagellar hook-associated protein 2